VPLWLWPSTVASPAQETSEVATRRLGRFYSSSGVVASSVSSCTASTSPMDTTVAQERNAGYPVRLRVCDGGNGQEMGRDPGGMAWSGAHD
jgi:hypothetical protein